MRFSCYDCGASVAAEGPAPPARCECGEPLWLDPSEGTFDFEDVSPVERMWAFGELLPVAAPGGLADAVGGTPLVRTAGLDEYAGCHVRVKDETANPTGSFKDRGSALGVAAAVEADAPAVGTVSHGNMAMSTAAFAAEADVPCVVFVPADISTERLANIARFEPRIVRVEGDYGRLYHEALAAGRDRDIPFVNSDVPLRVAGQKTTVLEVLAETAPAFPDAVVLPVSSGGHASGAWKAVTDLATAGYEDLPRLYLVQAAACDPIAKAYRRGLEAVSPIDGGETIAYSIANADPPSGTRALRAARATGGAVLSVDDDAIRAARRRLAVDAGLNVEPASATTLAATKCLVEDGQLAADDDVVLVATGSGYKEHGDVRVDASTVSLGEIDAALSRVEASG